MKTSTFQHVMIRGIVGALIGIISGLILATLIWTLVMGIMWISAKP